MISPRPVDVFTFLWSHLEKDVSVLGQTLDLNLDNAAVTVHLVVSGCADFTAGDRHRQREAPVAPVEKPTCH